MTVGKWIVVGVLMSVSSITRQPLGTSFHVQVGVVIGSAYT